MHRNSRPPHHPRRPAERAAGTRPRPSPHRRMPPPQQAPPAQGTASRRVGAHARLSRPLLYKEPRLLHYSRRAARRSGRPPARIRHRRRVATGRQQRHHARPYRLALRRTRAPAHRPAGANGRRAMDRLLITVPEAAEALAISRSKLYELLASGAIASIRIDGSRRIPLTALEEYISRLLAGKPAA